VLKENGITDSVTIRTSFKNEGKHFEKVRTILWPASPLLGIYPKELKTEIQINSCEGLFRAGL
jgi:hypothetical protein